MTGFPSHLSTINSSAQIAANSSIVWFVTFVGMRPSSEIASGSSSLRIPTPYSIVRSPQTQTTPAPPTPRYAEPSQYAITGLGIAPHDAYVNYLGRGRPQVDHKFASSHEFYSHHIADFVFKREAHEQNRIGARI